MAPRLTLDGNHVNLDFSLLTPTPGIIPIIFNNIILLKILASYHPLMRLKRIKTGVGCQSVRSLNKNRKSSLFSVHP